jgi:hypothetical protein
MTDAPETIWVDPSSMDDLNMYVGHASSTMDYLNMDVEYTRTAYLVAAQARIAELEAALEGAAMIAVMKTHSAKLRSCTEDTALRALREVAQEIRAALKAKP